MRKCHNSYYQGYSPTPHYYDPHRQYAPVNPVMFMNSAKQTAGILNDALQLINQIRNSQSFARKLMDAAQHSKTNDVKKAIAEAGIHSKTDIHYNPNGLIFVLSNQHDPLDCCQVSIRLRWM